MKVLKNNRRERKSISSIINVIVSCCKEQLQISNTQEIFAEQLFDRWNPLS